MVEFWKKDSPCTHVLVWLKKETEDATYVLMDSFLRWKFQFLQWKFHTPSHGPSWDALTEEFMIHGSSGASNPTCPYERWCVF